MCKYSLWVLLSHISWKGGRFSGRLFTSYKVYFIIEDFHRIIMKGPPRFQELRIWMKNNVPWVFFCVYHNCSGHQILRKSCFTNFVFSAKDPFPGCLIFVTSMHRVSNCWTTQVLNALHQARCKEGVKARSCTTAPCLGSCWNVGRNKTLSIMGWTTYQQVQDFFHQQ